MQLRQKTSHGLSEDILFNNRHARNGENRVNCETAVGIFFNTGSEIESRDIGFGLYSLSFLFEEIGTQSHA